MLTLADVKPRIVDVKIVFAEGQELIVPLRVPSWVEWNELGLEVPTAEPEMKIALKGCKEAYEKESGAVYDEKVVIANNQRMVRRLTFALIEAGNFPELARSSAAEQMDAVQRMDAGILQALARTLSSLVQFTQGTVSNKVERFRDGRVSANGHGNLLEDELDARILEAAAVNGKRTVDRVADPSPLDLFPIIFNDLFSKLRPCNRQIARTIL